MKEINNNIQESYCSIEVSKLLKEKGCNLNTEKVFLEGFIIPFWKDGLCSKDKDIIVCEYISHTLAIEWLRVNFGIWIMIESMGITNDIKFNYFITRFWKHNSDGIILPYRVMNFNSPQEAIEAALLHTLEKII